jgi:hypothetical protein
MVAADRLTSVPGASLGRSGNVMRVEVRRGDVTHDGWRAEALGPRELSRFWSVRYSWWTFFPIGYPAEIKLVYGPNAGNPAFQVFTQWHHSGSSGSPPLAFVVQPPKAGGGSDFRIRVGVVASSTGQRHYVGIADLNRGQWHHFDIEVRWNPTDGWLKVRHNGQQTMFTPAESDGLLQESTDRLTSLATLYPGQHNYLKMGLYRPVDQENSKNYANPGEAHSILYHDDVRRMIPVWAWLIEKCPRLRGLLHRG